jgi:hypothetical protein
MTDMNNNEPTARLAGRTGRRNTGDPAGTYTGTSRFWDRATVLEDDERGTITLAEYRRRSA